MPSSYLVIQVSGKTVSIETLLSLVVVTLAAKERKRQSEDPCCPF